MGESMLPKPTLLVPLHLYSKVCPLELTNHLEELLGGKIQPNQQPTTTCTLEMVTQQWWWWVHAKGRLPLLELYYYYYYYPFGLSIHPSFDKLYPEISSQWSHPNGQQQAQVTDWMGMTITTQFDTLDSILTHFAILLNRLTFNFFPSLEPHSCYSEWLWSGLEIILMTDF